MMLRLLKAAFPLVEASGGSSKFWDDLMLAKQGDTYN